MKQINLKSATAISFFLTLMLIFDTGCTYAWKGVKGNGNIVKQTRDISDFHGIDVGGAFHVFLTQGDEESLTLEADENLMETIVTQVRGGILQIETKDNIRDSHALNVYITFKDLDRLEISGACQFTSRNKFKLNDLDLDCSGASEVKLKLSAADVDMEGSGASDIEMVGHALSMNLDLSGASNLDAYEMELENADVDISGASHAKIMVASELSAEVSGAGSLKYKGDAKLIEHDVSGAGSIKKM